MPYAYDLELSDFQAAQRLHLHHDSRARFWFMVWQRVMPAISICALVLLLHDVLFRNFSYPAWLVGLLSGTAFLGLYCLAMRPLMIRKAFRSARSELGDRPHPVELEIAEDKLVSRVPGRSEGRFERAAVIDYVEDDKVALLYLSKRKFLYIPKSALPPHGWSELRDWMAGA